MEIGVFIPIGNNGWLISSTSPQYTPSFDLNREIVQIVRLPEIQTRLLQFGDVAVATTPDETRAFINAETTKWAKVIRDANIKLEGA